MQGVRVSLFSIIAMLGGIVLLTIFAYAPALQNGFVDWDDPTLITQNALIRTFSLRGFWSYDPELYIPLTLLHFQIEHALFGFDPFFFHLDSLLLHLVNVALVFTLLKLLLTCPTAAALGALLFAVHPLHVEAVAWASARKELLSACFGLAAIIAYLRSDGGTKRSAAIQAFVFLLLSFLSKASGVLLPAVFLSLDAWRGGHFTWRDVRRTWPFWFLAAIFIVIAFFGKKSTLAFLPPSGVVLLAFRSVLFYLQKFFLPVGLSAIYPAPVAGLHLTDPAQLFAVASVLTLFGGAWVLRRKFPELLVGLGVFLLLIAPSFLAYAKSSEITLAADRYAYLPSVGILFLVVAIAQKLLRAPPLCASVVTVTVVLALFAAGAVRTQARRWQSTHTLFSAVLERYPSSPVALNNVGYQYLAEGRLEEALLLFERAVALNPAYPDALLNLGVVAAKRGDYDTAERAIQRALALDPALVPAHFSLAGLSLIRGHLEDASALYRATLGHDPDYLPALWQLAQVSLRLGKTDDARTAYLHVLDLDPSYRGKLPTLDALL